MSMDMFISISILLSLPLTSTRDATMSQREDFYYSKGHLDEKGLVNLRASEFPSPSRLVCCMECIRDFNCQGIIFKRAVKRCLILRELPPTLQRTLNPPVYKILARQRDFSEQQVAIVFLDVNIYTLNLNTTQWKKLSIVGWLYNTVECSFFFEDYVYFVVDAVYKFKVDSADVDFVSVTEVYRPIHKKWEQAICGLTFDKQTREMFITMPHAVLAVDIYNKTDTIIRNVPVEIIRSLNLVHVSKTRMLYFGAKSSIHTCTYEGGSYRQITRRQISGPWSLTVDIKGNRLLWSGYDSIYEMDLVKLTPRFLSRSEGIPVIVILSDGQLLLMGYGKVKAEKRSIVKLSKNGTLTEQQQLGLIPECNRCIVRGTRLLNLPNSSSKLYSGEEGKRTYVIAISDKGMFMLKIGTKIFRKISVSGFDYRLANGIVFVNGSLYIADNIIHRGRLWQDDTSNMYSVKDHFKIKNKDYSATLHGLAIDVEAGLMFTLGPNAVYSVSIETRVDKTILSLRERVMLGNGIVNFGLERLLYFTVGRSLRRCSYVGEEVFGITMLPELPIGITLDEDEHRLLWIGDFRGTLYSMDLGSHDYHVIRRIEDARVSPLVRPLTGGRLMLIGYKGTVMLYSKDGKPTAKLGDIPECDKCRILAATVVQYALE